MLRCCEDIKVRDMIQLDDELCVLADVSGVIHD